MLDHIGYVDRWVFITVEESKITPWGRWIGLWTLLIHDFKSKDERQDKKKNTEGNSQKEGKSFQRLVNIGYCGRQYYGAMDEK